MALSGFEGFEKRLELQFSGDDPIGLRRMDVDALQQVLDEVQCTIVSAAGNRYFDAYVLSESSLFVYPYKLIIKTCGTTQLLRSVPCLLRHTSDLGLSLHACRYSRGSFIFPEAQPFPHTSFTDEVVYLEDRLPATLCHRKACVMPTNASRSSAWHVFSAAEVAPAAPLNNGCAPGASAVTVEVCMKELDREMARRFYRKKGDDRSGDDAGADMTELAGIGGINPRALICGFAFDPCGYSMNGLDQDHYSTIHVTPEDGHSYASFECDGHWTAAGSEIIEHLTKAISLFRPGYVSVSFCMADGPCDHDALAAAVVDALDPLGLSSRSQAACEFPGAGTVTHQTLLARRN